MATLTITGAIRECNCNHCGRPLKLGVRTDEVGTIGADCFVKLTTRDTKRFNGNGRPSADIVKNYALIANKGLAYAAQCYGYSARHFIFAAA
jgi:hypothetical protein